MQIRVLKVDGPTAQGNFKFVNVAYDNGGKVGSKKLMNFKYPEVFNVFTTAQPNDMYEVESVKEGDYWNWKSAKKVDATAAPKQTAASVSPVSNKSWETAEERSIRQRNIQRQNALGNAIALLKTEKVVPALSEVLAVAEKMEAWIDRNDPIDGVIGMADDFPWDTESKVE